ncbi:Transmembrane channel-like protein 6, partial [Nibea albiflora]
SPVDEEVVHDSFNQLIAEQCRNDGLSDALELQQLQRDLEEEEGRDDVPYLSRPGHEFRGDRLGRSDVEWYDGERHGDPLIAERWSSATLKVLSSMPSRTIGRSRGAIISQYYNRTMQLRRRRQSRPSIRDFSHSARPSIRGYGMEVDSTDAEGTEVSKRERLVNNLQNLSASDRVRMLRAMPLSVAEKGELRRLALQKEKPTFSGSKIPCCSRLKFYIIIAFRQSWYSWLSFVHSLQLWQVALKRVSGRFGTGVLSYFLFLKTLLFFNVFLFLVTGAFLVLPQAVHPPAAAPNRPSFSGLELLTGAGYFSDTVMYYGYYSNYTLKSCRDDVGVHNVSVSNGTSNQHCASRQNSYNMPLAYFFTIGVAFFITCIILVYSMSKSFGQSFRIDKSHSILAIKVFCSWDFKVIKKTSVKLMSGNICTQLKELLAEVNHKNVNNTACQKLWRLMIHGLAWVICIGSTFGCVLGIYHFSVYMHQTPPSNEARLLALPVLVSLINLLLPGLFNLAAWMEDYDSPSVCTYVAIGRNLMLKVSILGVLCNHWLRRVADDREIIGLTCWESFVGQELYRFLLMEFIFTLLDTLFGELLWRLFSERVLKRRRKPVFDIARNVLELIYGQTLAWYGTHCTDAHSCVKSALLGNDSELCFRLGVLFTPLLPAVQILKLLLLFYIKKEGEDKKFLITRLQSIHEQKRTPARRLTSQVGLC